ncbi:MAG: hypothetical protein ACI845_004353 [Gammaproteobacteria bacterium]|jgi:thioesterase domain-containing protein
MKTPEWIQPAIWGMICGGIGTVMVGFSYGGWVLPETAKQMETASAELAIIKAFTPLCVARAESQTDNLAALKTEIKWKRDDFVIGVGWVDDVSQDYRSEVAKVCATSLIEAMNAK